MDGGLFVQAPRRMAAVVDALLNPSLFEKSVRRISPCRPPEDELLLTVPTDGYGILPAVFRAFGVLGKLHLTKFSISDFNAFSLAKALFA